MKNKIRLLLLIFMLNSAWLFGNDPARLDCSSYFTWERINSGNALIQFNNLSTGEFNTWMWDFGDGMTSSVFNPVHEFTGFGTYYVCLSISDGLNCDDIYCDTVVITVGCEADFDITYVPTTPPLVQFTDLSTGYPDSWFWQFGDGTSSSEQNPVHTYYDPGTYGVSLIIHHSDTLYPCTDSIHKIVIIPDSLDCEAFYTYDIDEDYPLEVHFFDHSVGNITDWEWDFGDGYVSNEQNPEHIYAQTGEYLICLKVENNDTAANCLHFICETIILEDSIQCVADFLAVADSSSNVMYKYNFYDQSSGNPDGWLWDFGDGNYSQEQYPVNIYEAAGTYEVCLNSWNSNHPGCNDSYCILVQTANYFQLGGMAFIGQNPLNNPSSTGDTGIAILYRQRKDLSLIAVDTNVFHELGYYWFNNMMELDYMIWISLTPGSDHYEDFVPSYFPEAMGWQDADIFSLSDNLYEMNTSLMEAQGADIGPGHIGGRVISGNKYGVEAYFSFHDVTVILTDQSSTPLEWTTTDEYGQFEFNNIALGSYKVYADVTGIWSQPETVIIDEEFPFIDTVLIRMYEGAPFSVQEPVDNLIRISSLYPNPVINNMTLQLSAEKPLLLRMNIINITGQTIYTIDKLTVQGSNTFVVPTEKIPSGIYLISLSWDGQKQMITKKFIKN